MNAHEKDSLMKQHLEQWKTSGSTQTAYCRQHRIAIHIFSYYKKKLGYGIAHSGRGDNQLIPIGILPDPCRRESMRISHDNGFSLEIYPASNLAELKPVLELLRSLS